MSPVFSPNGQVKQSFIADQRIDRSELKRSLGKTPRGKRKHDESSTRESRHAPQCKSLAPRRVSRRALLFIPSRHARRSLESARTHTAPGASCIVYCRIFENLYASRSLPPFVASRDIVTLKEGMALRWRIGGFSRTANSSRTDGKSITDQRLYINNQVN